MDHMAAPGHPRLVGTNRARRAAVGGIAAGCATTGIAALAALAAPRAAQAADAVVDSASDLGEIVVQARRRDERQSDVPAAVSVVTGSQLQQQDAVVFGDVAREVPNVRMTQSPQSESALDVSMRGQTAIRAAIDYDPAVGIYVDGVYVANGQAAMNTLLDIDDVQIVRGAQGTLFGRNNTGGSIMFSTRRPQLDQYSSEAALDAGTFQLFSGRAIVNVPLGDTLAVRMAYQADNRQGYGASVGSGQGNFGNRAREQLRVGALWRPTAGFDAYWTYEHFDADETGALLHPLHGTLVEALGQALQQFPAPGIAPVVIPDNPYQTDADFLAHDQSRLEATQLTLNQALDPLTRARLILAYRHLHNDTAIDVDATTLPIANTALFNASSQKSAEFQLSGLSLDSRLDWVGGLYWFRDDGSAPSVLAPPSPAYQQVLQQLQQTLSPYPVVESNAVQNLSSAAYLHGEYHVTDRWSAAAGVRHTSDTRRLSEDSYALVPGLGQSCTITGQSPLAPCPPFDHSVDFGYWSWELSSRYRVTPDAHLYVRSGRAQRSGGWNVPVNTFQDQPFRPEQITDLELGGKAAMLGGALDVNADVFAGNYDDMQRLLPRVVGGTPTTYVINAGRARVDGAELESTLKAARGAALRLAAGWTDARYRDFRYSGDPARPPVDLSGNRFSGTPRFNADLGGDYETPMGGGAVRLHADYAWQDTVQFNVINDFNSQGAYGTLNARATFVAPGGRWDLAAFGTNLTGRQYAVAGGSVAALPSPVPAFSWQIPGAPRMFGVELTVRVGAARNAPS